MRSSTAFQTLILKILRSQNSTALPNCLVYNFHLYLSLFTPESDDSEELQSAKINHEGSGNWVGVGMTAWEVMEAAVAVNSMTFSRYFIINK